MGKTIEKQKQKVKYEMKKHEMIKHEIMLENQIKVTFLYHSGFLVELPHLIFLFDYYKGVIPDLDSQKSIYVFSSHRHPDHFCFEIFALAEKYPNVKYLLSRDIGKKYKKKYMLEKKGISQNVYRSIIYLKEDELWEDESVIVQTIPSTDAGAAFLIQEKQEKQENRAVYHAGDLNWWTWEGETREEYQAMTKKFKASMEMIKQRLWEMNISSLDAAFVPLDPRQKERYAKGFDFFMRSIPVKHVFPMHAFGDYSVIKKLMKDDLSEDYRDKIINICGDEKRRVKILNPEMRRRIKELLK